MDSTKRDLALLLQQDSRFCFSGIFCGLQQTGISLGGRIQPWSSPAHTVQQPEIFQFWAQYYHKNCAKPEQLKTQKASLVSSPAIANLCYKLINTALVECYISQYLPQSCLRAATKSYSSYLAGKWSDFQTTRHTCELNSFFWWIFNGVYFGFYCLELRYFFARFVLKCKYM